MGFIEIVEDHETFELEMGDSKFTLRRLDSDVYRNIEKKHTRKEKNLRTGQWIRDTDDHGVNEDVLDYVVLGWEGIKSPTTGDDVPCTKEMKQKLPGNVKLRILDACDADSITEKKTN